MGSLLGFLRYNWRPASIYMGDSGAMFIGLMLGALSMIGLPPTAGFLGKWFMLLGAIEFAGKLDARKLRARATSAAVKARVEGSTAEFFAHQVNQRPAFVLTDAIGDKAVFSGLVRLEPLAATIDAMLADTAAYASHRAHFGDPPTT